MAKSKYTAADIEVLEGLEPVRKRPGMYIAGTDTPEGLHQLVYEILDNSVDEAMNGHANRIDVILHPDRTTVTVRDNGRGIPTEKHPKFKKSALELILTTLHAGGKFSDKNYITAGGLHGVGSSVVNALSAEMLAVVRRGGKEFQQSFKQGKVASKMKTSKISARGSGTSITFRPDPEIFKKTDFSPKRLRRTIRTKAYLNPGLRLTFEDQKTKEKEEFFYEDGMLSFLKEKLEEKKTKVLGDEPFFIERTDQITVSIAFAWSQSTKEDLVSYANGIYTADGGSHEQGFRAGIVKAIRNYINVHDISLKGIKLTSDDIREGLIGLLSVKIPSNVFQTQFQGQTKSKLNNPEIAPLVEAVARTLEQVLNEKPSTAQAIVDRIIMAAKARAASRAAGQSVRRKIGISHRLTLPGKLADCSSIRPEETEIFIVEGDSAGGSAKQGRDRNFQAVLPLRGKVLNTIASPTKKVADNKELSNIVSALGCGLGPEMNLDKLRYGKVIILTDADADGMHIATLLMAFFFQHMRPLVEGGHLYIGKPPLFGVFGRGAALNGQKPEVKKSKGKKSKSTKASSAKSKGVHWAYSDEELNAIIKKQKLENARITRYKGLGEMNPATLWETTLDPDTRTLLRITVDDQDYVEQGLKALMGSDPSRRTQLIQESAEEVEVDV